MMLERVEGHGVRATKDLNAVDAWQHELENQGDLGCGVVFAMWSRPPHDRALEAIILDNVHACLP